MLKRNKLKWFTAVAWTMENMSYQSKQSPPLPAWPLRRLPMYRPRGAVPLSVVLRSSSTGYPWFGRPARRQCCLVYGIDSRCGRQ
jgi:hypothetical protein